MLQRVFVFLLFILVLPDILIYFKYIIRLTKNIYLRCLYWLPSILLLSGVVYLVTLADSEFFASHVHAIGWFSIFFFLFASPKLLLCLCIVIGMPFHLLFRWPRRPFLYTGLTLALCNIVIILYGSFIGKTQFEIKPVTFTSKRLPAAFDGYKIVQLSDIHIGSWQGDPAVMKRMVELANAQKPDLIVFTGDLINSRTSELKEFQSALAQLKAKDGVYSILGNHDYGTYYKWKTPEEMNANFLDLKKRQKSMGWKMLNNAHTFIRKGNDSIALIGVENEGEPPFSQHGDLIKAMKGTENAFQILLSHNPTHWRKEVLPKSSIDLMLAGHTHATQFKIGDISPASYVYPEWAGLYLEGNRGLYVNVGIGYVGLPFRFGAWPEITVITLRR